VKTGNIISTIVASLLLTACGGSDTPSTTDASTLSNKVLKGYYVDSAVEGVEFNCTTASGATRSGTTDANGTFTFEENQTCTFKIGDVVLREVNASLLKDKITIFEDNKSVAKLLQSFDKDGDASNGIEILPEVHEVMEEQNLREVSTDTTALVELLDKVKEKKPTEFKGEVVTDAEVEAHLDNTRKELASKGVTTQYDVEDNSDTGSNREQTQPERVTNTNSNVEETQSDRTNTGSNTERTQTEVPNNAGSNREQTQSEVPTTAGSNSERI
jgi:hypothetical protein